MKHREFSAVTVTYPSPPVLQTTLPEFRVAITTAGESVAVRCTSADICTMMVYAYSGAGRSGRMPRMGTGGWTPSSQALQEQVRERTV